jgi:hypothetical protein
MSSAAPSELRWKIANWAREKKGEAQRRWRELMRWFQNHMRKDIGCCVCAIYLLAMTATCSWAEVVTVIAADSPLPAISAAQDKISGDAAADLCDYLARVSGRQVQPGAPAADAKVIFHVGADAFVLQHAPEVKELYADGYLLKHVADAGKDYIILAGVRGDSARWAVEGFLKQFCGVRFLFPYDEKFGEIVPSKPTITVTFGLNEKHEPHYMDRSNMAMYYYNRQKTYLRLRPSRNSPFGSHAFQVIFTQADYEAHPEWFAVFTIPDNWVKAIAGRSFPTASNKVIEALARGERRGRWHWSHGADWQICMSNPDTVQHAVEYARKYFKDNPQESVVSMGHNDNAGWCECPQCAAFANSVQPAYTISEQYWDWVNRVARELAKTDPDKLITTIAYGEPSIPPRFPLEKNVTVMVTVYADGHLDLVKRWQKKCSRVNLYSYAYGFFFLGFRHYPHAMHDFLKWGHEELGAVSHVCECSGNWSFDGPKYYYTQNLMWDVNADPDQLMAEYCKDWFGAAAARMRAFWDRHEAVYERRGPDRRLLFYQWVGFSPSYDEFDRFTLEDVQVLDASIVEAQRLADTEGDRFRVARVADAWQYFRAMLVGKLKFADLSEQRLAEAAQSGDRAMALAKELADLQSQKQHYLDQLRAHPNINLYIASNDYYSTFSRVRLFTDVRTLLDQLCDRVTANLQQDLKERWRAVAQDDPLHESARTQLYMIEHPARVNALINGDMEKSDLSGWDVSGEVAISNAAVRGGKSAALGKGTISQSVAVKPGERYRLTAWGKYPTAPKPGAVLFGIEATFQAGGKAMYPEPTYRRLNKIRSPDEWTELQATFTVPPKADKAIISLNPERSSDLPVAWDDVTLETIFKPPG